MSYRTGALRHKLPILRKDTNSKNDFGEVVDSWSEVFTVRASVRRLRGSENIEQRELIDVFWIEVDVRSQYGIREQDRVVYEGNEFSIEFINPDYLGRWKTLRCKRINE